MKKIIAILLALCTIASIFVGCSSSGEGQPVSTSAPDNSTEISTEKPTKAPETTISESVIHESEEVKITVTGLADGNYGGKEVKFLVENYTDRNIVFSGNYFVVNGIMLPCWLYIEVAPGKKANGALEINEDRLTIANITDIATVVGYDTAIVDTDSFDTLFEVPVNIETSIAGTYTQAIDESGTILYDQDGISVVAQYLWETFSGYEVQLLIKNNTEQDITASTFNVSINGYTIDAWMYEIIPAGTCCFGSISFYNEDLEESSIDVVEDAAFFVEFQNPHTYDTILTTDELQVSFNEG